MTLSTILQQINKKGKIQPKVSSSSSGNDDNLSSRIQSYKATTSNKPIDPVVAKLKEKRRLEREKKEQELRLKKGLAPKPVKSTTTRQPKSTSASPKKTQPNSKTSRGQPPPPPPPHPLPTNNDLRKKKLNFNELMKKASKIDHDKLSIKFPAKSKSPEVGPARIRTPDKPNTIKPDIPRDERFKKPVAQLKRANTLPPPPPPPPLKATLKAPIPTRKPSEKIQQKINEKKNTKKKYQEYEEEEDDELSSFIASDEEEEAYDSRDYDRDEIWAMFNRGKKRSYYDRYDDYDSGDDMEATGAEILDEEYRSRVNGELEDRRELEQEKKLAALKRARLHKSR
ncbi:uncharacterized protein SPAPADRAFT_56609 [Spathaspora passalidarum NRRL Y-27907]|uniref:SPT2 chromatin protein n=1 Tax=Spathaspora passalidarum (strain NRRL Y-27907 / 11-Y1) TaxID=619300 RepID=G3AS12_SPAPN|nr:uncharacterized protein SPAPADRAFT_56609 [Spathaspora passalidarum NRRL Y-27907]EGW31861.1 hypothetical protein SPAPADRAFT_56609 [Spathaspora passalidarum NRRL Y-27907]